MNDFSSKADDLLDKFMKITNTVGNQIHGMNLFHCETSGNK